MYYNMESPCYNIVIIVTDIRTNVCIRIILDQRTYIHSKTHIYRIVQLCGGGKYWRIGLSPRIGGEIFGEFGFTS